MRVEPRLQERKIVVNLKEELVELIVVENSSQRILSRGTIHSENAPSDVAINAFLESTGN